MGPAQPPEHRSAQFEDSGPKDARKGAQPQDPTQQVDAGSGDHQGEDDLDGEKELKRKDVADEGGQAEGSRLPVEGKRHPEAFVRIPEREVTLVHLRPGQGRPRDDLV